MSNEILTLAENIIEHGDNIAYPSRQSSQYVRKVMQSLVEAFRDMETRALHAETVLAEQDAVDDSDPPTKWLVESLRRLARDLLADPKTPWIGERDPKQHICWTAADRLMRTPAQGASLRQALIEVTKCETALRMGGPAPEDLEGLSIALEKAVEIAANALDAAQPQVAPVETKSASEMIAACYEGLCPDGSSALDFEWARQRGYILPNNGSGKLSPAQCSAGNATEPVVCPTCGGPCKLSFHGAVSVKYDENGRAHHRPGPPVTDELILRVAVAIASRRDAFKPGEKLAQSYLDDAREAVAVFRAVPQPVPVTSDVRVK